MSGGAGQALVDEMVAVNLAAVRARIAACRATVGRDAAAVTLVAVSKAQPDGRVLAALAAGQRVFGENYVQEAKARWPALRARHPDLVLHMIGPVQRNKAKEPSRLFDVIETVDRAKLARALAEEMARQGRRPACSSRSTPARSRRRQGSCPTEADALHRAVPRARAAGARPYGDPAGRRGAVAALRAARGSRQTQRPRPAQHGHERRLRDGGAVRRHPRARRQRDLRRQAAEDRLCRLTVRPRSLRHETDHLACELSEERQHLAAGDCRPDRPARAPVRSERLGETAPAFSGLTSASSPIMASRCHLRAGRGASLLGRDPARHLLEFRKGSLPEDAQRCSQIRLRPLP